MLEAFIVWMFLAQVPPPPPVTAWIGPGSIAEFEHSGLNASGGAETLKDCQLALTSVLVTDPSAAGNISKSQRAPVKAGTNSITLTEIGTAPEGVYKLWAEVYDQKGLRSGWFGGIVVGIDNTPPAPGTNLKIKIEGQASLEINGDDVTGSFTGKVVKG